MSRCVIVAALSLGFYALARQAWDAEYVGAPNILRGVMEMPERWRIKSPVSLHVDAGWWPTSPLLLTVPRLMHASVWLSLGSAVLAIRYAVQARRAGEDARWFAGPAAVGLVSGLLALRLWSWLP